MSKVKGQKSQPKAGPPQAEKVHDKTSPRGRAGFVVLYTVLIATIILAITIGIALIAYNQVILSSSVAEGGEAFFAADSGAECALYWDRQTPSQFSEFLEGQSYNIFCGNDPDLGSDFGLSDFGGKARFYLNIFEEDFATSIGCAAVMVDKNFEFEDGSTGTEIISLGYNVDCFTVENYDLDPLLPLPPRTIQRAIRVTY